MESSRENGDLRPAPYFPRSRADLHDLLLDLGHFELEQRLHEQRVAAGKDQPGPLGVSSRRLNTARMVSP